MREQALSLVPRECGRKQLHAFENRYGHASGSMESRAGSKQLMAVSIEKELTILGQVPGFGQYLSNALRLLVNGVNNLGQNVAVDPNGKLPAPPAVQQLTVKTNGMGLVHAVINDSNPISKNLHYFVEYDTNPNFSQPHVAHLGVSRTMHPITLPA